MLELKVVMTMTVKRFEFRASYQGAIRSVSEDKGYKT